MCLASSTLPLVAQATKPTPAWFEELTPSEQALMGRDLNINGVRDDVDAWVKNTYSDDLSQQAATLHIRWLTWAMIRGERRHPTTSDELDRMFAVSSCANEKIPTGLGVRPLRVAQLEALVFNNHARMKAYLTWDASTNGISGSVGMKPCEEMTEPPTP